jgi:alpha-L-rhamnosidase
LLNKLHIAFAWTFKSSAQFGYVADYGRDERTGWVGNNSMGEVYNFDMLNLYDSWLTDYQDTQLANGKISRVAPVQITKELLEKEGSGTPWLASYLTQPWDIYMAYGSKALLAKRYASMKQLVDYLRTDHVTDLIDSKGGIANWATQSLQPRTAYKVDPKLAGTACLYQCVALLSKMAKELGHQDDALYYATQSELIRAAFNAKFLSENRTYVGAKPNDQPTQTALAMALDLGLCPAEARGNVVKSLVGNIRENDTHLTTGVCGTRSLLPALCDNGEEELAYALATQTTFPSWGKWIVDGLTTCCEHWNEHCSTDIYYLGGPLDAYFFKYLAGISPTKPGYEEFTIKPHVKNALTNVTAVVNSVRGQVSCRWSKSGDNHFSMTVTVPVNTKAEVCIPTLGLGTRNIIITESGATIWDHGEATDRVKGVSFQNMRGAYLVWSVGSGRYCFDLKPSR